MLEILEHDCEFVLFCTFPLNSPTALIVLHLIGY